MTPPRPVDWAVRLAGDKSVMSALARVYPGPDPQVRQGDRGDYFLSSPDFLRFPDALDVMNAAAPLLATMCGLLNLCGNYVGEVWAENAEWIDAEGRRGGIGASVRMRANVVGAKDLARLEQRVTPEARTRATLLHSLAPHNPTLRTLLEVAGWHRLSWGDLYLLYELLTEALGGPKRLAEFGGVSKADLDRFRRTANTYRHATTVAHISFRRMSIHEAILLIRGLACSWIDAQL